MRIARSLRDLQVGWESRLFDFSTPRLFHGLDLLFAQRRQELSFRAVSLYISKWITLLFDVHIFERWSRCSMLSPDLEMSPDETAMAQIFKS